MAVDWRRRRPGLARQQGGYSGVGVKPVALRCAWAVSRAVSIPVIGCGGIRTADDVLEFLVAGCAAVQVGTACFSDPAALGELPARVSELLDAEGLPAVTELVGALEGERPARPAAECAP